VIDGAKALSFRRMLRVMLSSLQDNERQWRIALWVVAIGVFGGIVVVRLAPIILFHATFDEALVDTPEKVLAITRSYVERNGHARGTSTGTLQKLNEYGADLTIFDGLVHQPERYSSCDAPRRWYRVTQQEEDSRNINIEAFVAGNCASCWEVVRIHGWVWANGRVAKLWVERKPAWSSHLPMPAGRVCGPAPEK
jgi:hypothetical protein